MKAKKRKKPYMKLGLIKRDLVLRFKDGSKHLDDLILVKGWTEGAGDTVERDPAYQRLIDTFINTRKQAATQIRNGEKTIKQAAAWMEQLLKSIEKELVKAKAGELEGTTGKKDANRILTQADTCVTDVNRVFDEQVHGPFDVHRSFKTPNELDAKDVAEYLSKYYHNEMKPPYTKAVQYKKLCIATHQQIRDTHKLVVKWIDESESKVDNYSVAMADLRARIQTELEDARNVWTLMTPIEELERRMKDKIASIKKHSDDRDLMLHDANLASLDAKDYTTKFSSVQKHLAKVKQIAARADRIPKEFRKHRIIKPHYDTIVQTMKDAKQYDKDCQKYMKAGLKLYAEVKKLA